MYEGWGSLQDHIQSCYKSHQGTWYKCVLHVFNEKVGLEVAKTVVQNLIQIYNQSNQVHVPQLCSESEINWTTEVICYGLCLSFTPDYNDVIKSCVRVYIDWLSVLTDPHITVPLIIREDPNRYAQIMFGHLYNVFVPRKQADLFNRTSDESHLLRQYVSCSNILLKIQDIAENSTNITYETWSVMLEFLLAVNNTILSVPRDVKESDQWEALCRVVVERLMEIWLVACSRCFPSPSLWRTFCELAQSWRHHEHLVIQWRRVLLVLTARLLPQDYAPLILPVEDVRLVPASMTQDAVRETWFRLLHLLGNPVDLCHPQVIVDTQAFMTAAMMSPLDSCHAGNGVVEMFPCLRHLPSIFHLAMRALAQVIDMWLGITPILQLNSATGGTTLSHCAVVATMSNNSVGTTNDGPSSPTTAIQPSRRSAGPAPTLHNKKKNSGGSSGSHRSHTTSDAGNSCTTITASINSNNASSNPSVHLSHSSSIVTMTGGIVCPESINNDVAHPHRPSANSLLHLAGSWLFEAAVAGVKLEAPSQPNKDGLISARSAQVDPVKNELGRAEACGALCRIFCNSHSNPYILPVYLARFYICVYYALRTDEALLSGQVLSSVLLNGRSLLRANLPGVHILLPRLLDAVQFVLKEESRVRRPDGITVVQLRNAAIQLLLSMLCLPLHFKETPIIDLLPMLKSDFDIAGCSYVELRGRINHLMVEALCTEKDPLNTDLLLSGLTTVIEDMALEERVTRLQEQQQQQQQQKLIRNSSDSSVSSVSLNSVSPAEKPCNIILSTNNNNNNGVDSAVIGSGNRINVDVGVTAVGGGSGALHFSSASDVDYETASGLFNVALGTICQLLRSRWEGHFGTAISVMETLSCLAKVPLSQNTVSTRLNCKRAVKWICDHISVMLNRPPQEHRTQLHSQIVAAFHCLGVWLGEHPFLLQDRECLECVLETIELGVSGSKSKKRVSDKPKLKSDKQVKPASKRVQDVAGALLACVMTQVGAFPSPMGPAADGTLLDEKALRAAEENTSKGARHVRYFALDNALVLALLEHTSTEAGDMPAVTALVRGPFGRHAWSLRLRHLPRSCQNEQQHQFVEVQRPMACSDGPVLQQNINSVLSSARFFPESSEHVPLVRSCSSIPPLTDTAAFDLYRNQVDTLKDFVTSQTELERVNAERIRTDKLSETCIPDVECKSPPLVSEFQAARLFLLHLGFLTLDTVKEPHISTVPPRLCQLDASSHDFRSQLKQLDSLPTRTADSVLVFYIRAGKTSTEQILSNSTNLGSLDVRFRELLLALGWPVNVAQHPGWTGNPDTSYSNGSTAVPNHSADLFDGQHRLIYWADMHSELAVLLPSGANPLPLGAPLPRHSTVASAPLFSADSRSRAFSDIRNVPTVNTNANSGRNNHATADAQIHPIDSRSRMTLDIGGGLVRCSESIGEADLPHLNTPLDSNSSVVSSVSATPNCLTGISSRPTGIRGGVVSEGSARSLQSLRVALIWLEDLEDAQKFPTEQLLGCGCEAHLLFVLPLRCGLLRVMVRGGSNSSSSSSSVGTNSSPTLKQRQSGPLVDGLVVNRRVLPSLVRQTVTNLHMRRRLEQDSIPLPHVRRSAMIKLLVSKARMPLSEPEFFISLLQQPAGAIEPRF